MAATASGAPPPACCTSSSNSFANLSASSNPPPCKRCGNRDWRTEPRRKSRPRWLIEAVFAVPDVLIYQSESAGWPSRTYERWTCANCGRTVRVAT